MNTDIEIVIAGLVYNQTVVGTYGLVMSEVDGNRRFSVMIGEPEAQSIALKINNKKSPRPLTHDLIKTVLNTFQAQLEKVVIYDMVNEVFYSELHIRRGPDVAVIDARTSDAVALAVRAECPIFIKSDILDIVGTVVEADEPETPAEPDVTLPEDMSQDALNALPLSKLEDMLENAVNDEKYEIAAAIRDAINRKKEIH